MPEAVTVSFITEWDGTDEGLRDLVALVSAAFAGKRMQDLTIMPMREVESTRIVRREDG